MSSPRARWRWAQCDEASIGQHDRLGERVRQLDDNIRIFDSHIGSGAVLGAFAILGPSRPVLNCLLVDMA